MQIVIVCNLCVAIVCGLWGWAHLLSFEVSFFTSMLIIYTSYRSMLNKVIAWTHIAKSNKIPTNDTKNPKENPAHTAESNLTSENNDDCDMLNKKDKFTLGIKISFGILRILSYTLLAFGVIALINNQLFSIIAFLLGTLFCSFAMGIAVFKKIAK